MTTLQSDCSITVKVESVYGTAVTPDQSMEFLTESLQHKIDYAQGEGLRAGRIGEQPLLGGQRDGHRRGLGRCDLHRLGGEFHLAALFEEGAEGGDKSLEARRRLFERLGDQVDAGACHVAQGLRCLA